MTKISRMDAHGVQESRWFAAETFKRARAGDFQAGREALNLCCYELAKGSLTRETSGYLNERLSALLIALVESDRLGSVKRSTGSARSNRLSAIEEALLIKRPAKRPADPFPAWKLPLAILGWIVLGRGGKRDDAFSAMDEFRKHREKKSLHIREAEKILVIYTPLSEMAESELLNLLAPWDREKVPFYLPETHQ